VKTRRQTEIITIRHLWSAQTEKSFSIQFFKDGLPAPEQKLWESPWGKIGICICYDLSYTRVTDGLIQLGAQAMIVPTMDVSDWGRHEHELHTRIAPVRAAEYGIPIFRVASSGISQSVDSMGHVNASAPFPGELATIQSVLTFRRAGSLPIDRVIAPISVLVTAATIGCLVFTLLRRKRQLAKSNPVAK
jgi:apolipoprotein N-acyltransferase